MTGFGKPTNLSNTQGQVGKRVLQVRSAAVGRHVYVAWGDHSGKQSQVLLRTSNNSGKSFSSPIDISTPPAMGDGDMPELAATGKFVYILYSEFVGTPLIMTSPLLMIRTSQDFGSTFGKPIVLGLADRGDAQTWNWQIAATNKNVYVVWCPNPVENQLPGDILFTRSTDNAATFEPTIQLSNFVGLYPRDPKIAVLGELVCVVWRECDPFVGGTNSDVFFVMSHDSGKTFTKPLNVSNDSHSLRPHIGVSERHVYLTWVSVDDIANTSDIFFTFGYETDSKKPVNLTKNPNDYSSDYPQVAAHRNFVYVVWQTAYLPMGGTPMGDIFFLQDDKYGETFAAPLRVSAVKAWAGFAMVAVQNHKVSVTWGEQGLTAQGLPTNYLYYTSSDLELTAFEMPILLGEIADKTRAILPPLTPFTYVSWDWGFSPVEDDAFFVRAIP